MKTDVNNTNRKILIMGAGNLLLRDEGVGVHVVWQMQTMKVPLNVQIVDCGTSVLDFIPIIEEAERLIVIDTLKGGGKPGTIYKLEDKDVSEFNRMLTSVHEVSLMQSLDMMALTITRRPSVTIIGVEPKDINWGMELSDEVRSGIPAIIEIVLEETRRNKD
jgi:hydrogenase maturation protease